MNDINTCYVVEYSSKQKKFSIDKFSDKLKQNLKYLSEGKYLEWVPVAVVKDSQEAARLIEKLLVKFPNLETEER